MKYHKCYSKKLNPFSNLKSAENQRSFKFKLPVHVLRLCKIDNALNLTGIILERIQAFILLVVENDPSNIVRGYTCELCMEKVKVVLLEVFESQTRSYLSNQSNQLYFRRK